MDDTIQVLAVPYMQSGTRRGVTATGATLQEIARGEAFTSGAASTVDSKSDEK